MKKYVLALALGLGFAAQAQVQDFTLPSATGGAAFTLSAAESDYVALHFLLKTECPYCMRHTMTYATRSEELPGVRQVFIKPDTREEIQEWAAKVDDVGLDIYQDENAKLARDMGIPYGYKFHGQVVHYPALILLDKEGNEVLRYVGEHNGDRMSFDDLVERIGALKK